VPRSANLSEVARLRVLELIEAGEVSPTFDVAAKPMLASWIFSVLVS